MTGKIYTKKGDKGMTKTLRGPMSKGDQLAKTLGTVDELNSWVGLVRTRLLNDSRFMALDRELYRLQNNLLTIGSELAGSNKRIRVGETRNLERVIDRLTAELPELRNFVFPRGELQVARTIARRTEREVVELMKENGLVSGVEKNRILKYLNRLSDALFTMARWVNMKMGMEEEVWR